MNRWMNTLWISAALAVGGTAVAQYDRYAPVGGDNHVWARVVSVEPIVARYSSPEAREVCWEQPVTYYQPGRSYPTHRRDPATGALIGALVGGALGNQVGSGSGRKAATIAGAVIGGKVGADAATSSGTVREPDRYAEGYERVCETRTGQRTSDRIVGYDVAYELEGQLYNVRTDSHPGDQIRVGIVAYQD
jgi:uncharacterized protein YcfJ